MQLALELAQKDELNIYRVVQELLTNALRHSEASNVKLELISLPHRLILKYEDDGKGMPQDQGGRKGLGLKNMESRINALSGILKIDNPPEGGLRIKIEIENYENDKSSPGR